MIRLGRNWVGNRWGVEKTFSATAEWYKAYLAGGNMEDISRAQLQEFFPELS